MRFWAIGYLYQDDVFFNFLVEDTMMDMNEEFLLPSEQMAVDFIVNNLNGDFVPVEITIESYRNGVMTWNRGPVPNWDELYNVDDFYDDPFMDAIVEAEIIEDIIEEEIIEEEIIEEEEGY